MRDVRGQLDGMGQVQVWSASTGKLVTTLADTDTFEGGIEGLAWSPNGQYLAESSGQIHIWNAISWKRAASFGKVVTRAPQGTAGEYQYSMVESIAWSPIAAPSTEQTLYTWQLI